MEVKRHKHGKAVRYTKQSGFTFVHCRELFTILGLDWHHRRVKNVSTKKIKCPDAQGKTQLQTFLLATHMEKFLARSKRTDKAQWLREVFLGAPSAHKTLSEEKEEKHQSKPAPAPAPAHDLGKQNLDLMTCLKFLYENFHFPADMKRWIRELVPDIPEPKKRTPRPFRLDAVEVEENVLMVWLLRNSDGKVFVELALVLQLLSSPEPLEAYTDDKTFLTVKHEVDKFLTPDSEEENLDFIEIKHLKALEGHAGRTNSKLQAAIDKILRSLPREE